MLIENSDLGYVKIKVGINTKVLSVDSIFFESSNNIKKYLKKKGFTPNEAKTREILACLAQGRLFFEYARTAELVVKPILVYYGVMSFAGALILTQKGDLSRTHGLKTSISANNFISDITVEIQAKGTFSDINDTIAPCDSLNYQTWESYFKSTHHNKKISSTMSPELVGEVLSLKEIFSRLPSFNKLFFKTYEEIPKNLTIQIMSSTVDDSSIGNFFELYVCYIYKVISNRADLKVLLNYLDEKYSFLKNWSIVHASSYDNKQSRIGFINVENKSEEWLEKLKEEDQITFFVSPGVFSAETPFNFLESLPPIYDGVEGNYVTEPLNGKYLSEFSLIYLAAYILSSIARYYPSLWTSFIFHYKHANKPYHDEDYAIITYFLEYVLERVPTIVVNYFENN